MAKRTTIRGETRICSPEYGVTTVFGSGGNVRPARRTPCEQCPWRMDIPAEIFPAQAFRESAHTAYDAEMSTFACHMQGADKPATCAGFLLRHAEHNLGVRISQMQGKLDLSRLSDGGFPIYPSYREMAIANGVAPDDPCLRLIRANGDDFYSPHNAPNESS